MFGLSQLAREVVMASLPGLSQQLAEEGRVRGARTPARQPVWISTCISPLRTGRPAARSSAQLWKAQKRSPQLTPCHSAC